MTTAPPALDLALTGLPEDDHLRQVWHDHVSAWLHALATRVPPHLAASSYSLGLTLCDDAEISHLNTTWRGQEGPTDVLAFALQEDPLLAPPAPPHGDASWPAAAAIRGEPEDQPLELGDIVISTETARRQAEAEGHALSRELLFLASHGLLHLLGWDHPDDPSLAAMLDLQEALLAASAHLPSVTTASCQGEPTG